MNDEKKKDEQERKTNEDEMKKTSVARIKYGI